MGSGCLDNSLSRASFRFDDILGFRGIEGLGFKFRDRPQGLGFRV